MIAEGSHQSAGDVIIPAGHSGEGGGGSCFIQTSFNNQYLLSGRQREKGWRKLVKWVHPQLRFIFLCVKGEQIVLWFTDRKGTGSPGYVFRHLRLIRRPFYPLFYSSPRNLFPGTEFSLPSVPFLLLLLLHLSISNFHLC